MNSNVRGYKFAHRMAVSRLKLFLKQSGAVVVTNGNSHPLDMQVMFDPMRGANVRACFGVEVKCIRRVQFNELRAAILRKRRYCRRNKLREITVVVDERTPESRWLWKRGFKRFSLDHMHPFDPSRELPSAWLGSGA